MAMLYQYYFFTLLSLVFVVISHAANLSPEVYWKIKLPNTPMPKPIKDALHISEKTSQPYGGLTWDWFHVFSKNELHKLHQLSQPYGVYFYGVSLKNLNEDHLVTRFFFETDLHQGKKVNLKSLKNNNPAPLLPRKVVDSISFSSNRIEEILDHFSVDNNSEDAKVIKRTVELCEQPAADGEIKYCATSLESIIDFASSRLETNNILAIHTEVEKETPVLQTYTIKEVKEKANGKCVICHKVPYPYAVHFCHDVGSTRAFRVTMVGADGTKVNAVSVCHEDTASMNPKALVFQLLNIKPGDKPICHFIMDDQIALFPSQNAVLQMAEG
uniref:Capsicumin peptide n=1 Tax=Capsicum annuum TaxID=4072 RepID=A0A3G2GQL2_CAPAN|nr:capsicumin precursor peptide [Capsicum annuum]